ncbi:MAG: hypothetical protein QUS14_11860, partial [Pyrinomonadaceae bacterium]|nr:hypothetical protein [Pyrinomonadaceae bacterium]
MKIIVGILIGLLLGAGITLYMTGGFPGTQPAVVGEPIQPPDPNGPPAGTVEVVLQEQFFNEVLGTIFTEVNSPRFALAENAGAGDCPSSLTVLPENSGVPTAVAFENGRLEARLAFSGTYRSIFGCLPFTGWAPAALDLRFDPQTRSVLGQLNVQSVNLKGINPAFGELVTQFVQSTLNSRVNPITIIQGQQLAFDQPIAAADGSLR